MCEMIDFVVENGFFGVLVEGWNFGWDGDWFNCEEIFFFIESYLDFDIEVLVVYVCECGVCLVGYYEIFGDLINYENQMDVGFVLYNCLGIVQVKIGYVVD